MEMKPDDVKIDSKDISVIIQGPVYKKTDFSNKCTKEVVESIRELLPNAEIILSTWEESDVDDLKVDKVVFSKDPGNWNTDYGIVMENGSSLNSMNINRQIVSTVAGLQKATRKYAIKTRTDIILTKTDFLTDFLLYNNPSNKMYKDVLRHRVIAMSATNPRLNVPQPFFICDFFFFGFTEDLIKVWEIPLIDEKSQKKRPGTDNIGYYENYGAEQFLWLGFLRKYQNVECKNCQDISNNAIERSEISFASYAILMPAQTLGLYSLKIGKGGYLAKASNTGQYTYDDWKELYNRYCNGKIKIKNKLLKKIQYKAEYSGKRFLQNHCRWLFKTAKKIYNNR